MRSVFWLVVVAALLLVGCDADFGAYNRAAESVVVVDETSPQADQGSSNDQRPTDPVSDALAHAVDALLTE